MNARLVEIEGLFERTRATREQRKEIAWLIARVRELEAQAALDADVRAAADDLLTILKFQGNNHRRVLDLVDALAARMEAEE